MSQRSDSNIFTEKANHQSKSAFSVKPIYSYKGKRQLYFLLMLVDLGHVRVFFYKFW